LQAAVPLRDGVPATVEAVYAYVDAKFGPGGALVAEGVAEKAMLHILKCFTFLFL